MFDMVGKKFICNRDFPSVGISAGEVGYVFEQYKDFDVDGESGVQIIFEKGGYSGFGFEEQKLFLTEVNAPEDTFGHSGYVFRGVMHVAQDYRDGFWKF